MTSKPTAFTLAEGATHRGKLFTSLVRLCRAKQLSIVLREDFLCRGFARALENEVEVGIKSDQVPIPNPSLTREGKKAAFTLAEVLITLAIIGVVAAMTIPTLIVKINEKVTQNQEAVFRAKMIKGLNLTKTAGDLNNTYTSTYDFLVNGLGKNLKMAKVCDSSHIRDCIPYDIIIYDRGDDKEYSVNVKDMTTVDKLNLSF